MSVQTLRKEEMMKLVIDLPDEWKERIEHNRRPSTIECGQLVESIWNGIPLPKGYWVVLDLERSDEEIWEEDIQPKKKNTQD